MSIDLVPGLDHAAPEPPRRRASAPKKAKTPPPSGRAMFTQWVEGSKGSTFKLSHKAKVVWLTSFAQQVAVGITPEESLSNLAVKARPKKAGRREASCFAMEMIKRGYSFARAMEMIGTLDAAAITAIEAGHQSGKLGDALRQIADRLERSYKLKSKIRSAI